MKQIIPTYSFVASTKVITLSGFGTVRLDRLLLITNVTRNVIYYNFADSSTGATASSNTFTLVGASTSGHADTDKLEIIYDTVSGDPDYLTAQPVSDGGSTLSIDDGGGAITVDGTVTVQDGGGAISVDDNGTTLSVDDGGSSLTVDGTVTIQDGGNVISVDDAGSTLSVDDGGSSLTVDGTVGVSSTTGTATHTADVTVDNTGGGVTLLSSNSDRKAAIIQNTGSYNMRVSVGGTPTTTTGIQLAPGQSLTLTMPYIPTSTIKGIREGGTSTTAAVLEIA